MPPLLLLLIGFSVLTYRVQQTDWQGLQAGNPLLVLSNQESSTASVPAPSPESAVLPDEASAEPGSDADEPTAEPTDVEPEAPRALPSERILALAAELAEPSSVSRPALDSPQVDPPVPPPGLLAEAQKPVDPKQVWQDIQREADLKNRERAALESMKDQLLEEDRIQARERQAHQAEQRRQTVEEQNRAFREELAELLSSRKPETASEIRRLASLPQPRPRPRTVNGPGGTPRAQTLSRSIDLRRAWVARLRLDGQPDSLILEDLVEAHRLNRIARDGPKSDDQALIRAAIDLLSVPLDAHPDRLQQALLSPRSSPRSPSSGLPAAPTSARGSRYGHSRRR